MKTKTVGVYTRNHPSHAWAFEQECSPEMAEIARQVNKGFGGVETLVVPPVGGQFQRWLCSTTCSDWNPRRTFESPQEAIDYAKTRPDPVKAAREIVDVHIQMDECGFAAEVCELIPALWLTENREGEQ